METFVTRSKYVPEVISIFVDFADILPSGTSIQGTPTVTVALETGDDPTPSGILYLGVSVHNGTLVEQRVCQGVPGAIYVITFLVFNGSEYFSKTTYLGILPEIAEVTPEYLIFYLTTLPYPYEFSEFGESYIQLNHGLLVQVFVEAGVSNISLVSGALIGNPVSYTYSYEAGITSINIVSGTLITVVYPVSYTYSYEAGTSGIALISGTFIGTPVTYTYGPENGQSGITLISGTLI